MTNNIHPSSYPILTKTVVTLLINTLEGNGPIKRQSTIQRTFTRLNNLADQKNVPPEQLRSWLARLQATAIHSEHAAIFDEVRSFLATGQLPENQQDTPDTAQLQDNSDQGALPNLRKHLNYLIFPNFFLLDPSAGMSHPANPRAIRTHGFRSHQILIDAWHNENKALTVAEYRTLGGRMKDLAWDRHHNYVRIVKPHDAERVMNETINALRNSHPES